MSQKNIPTLLTASAAAAAAGVDVRTFLKRAALFGVQPTAVVQSGDVRKPMPVFDTKAVRTVVDQTRRHAEDTIQQIEQGGGE